MASESSITTSGYIKHHLQNLTYGEKQVETATGIWESTGELGLRPQVKKQHKWASGQLTLIRCCFQSYLVR